MGGLLFAAWSSPTSTGARLSSLSSSSTSTSLSSGRGENAKGLFGAHASISPLTLNDPSRPHLVLARGLRDLGGHPRGDAVLQGHNCPISYSEWDMSYSYWDMSQYWNMLRQIRSIVPEGRRSQSGAKYPKRRTLVDSRANSQEAQPASQEVQINRKRAGGNPPGEPMASIRHTRASTHQGE